MSRLEHLRHRRFVDAFLDGEIRAPLDERVSRHVTLCTACLDRLVVSVHVKASLARNRQECPDPSTGFTDPCDDSTT